MLRFHYFSICYNKMKTNYLNSTLSIPFFIVPYFYFLLLKFKFYGVHKKIFYLFTSRKTRINNT